MFSFTEEGEQQCGDFRVAVPVVPVAEDCLEKAEAGLYAGATAVVAVTVVAVVVTAGARRIRMRYIMGVARWRIEQPELCTVVHTGRAKLGTLAGRYSILLAGCGLPVLTKLFLCGCSIMVPTES